MSHSRIGATFCIVLLVGVAFSACSGDSDEDGSNGLPPPSGFLAEPPCVACIDDKCALELRTCNADPICKALRACRAACNDATCDAECLAGEPESSLPAAFMERLAVCAEFSCGPECADEPVPEENIEQCAALFDAAVGAARAEACVPQRDCVCRECNEQWRVCLSDAECAERLSCSLELCVGTPVFGTQCASECFAPGYPQTLVAAYSCGQNQCTITCSSAD